MKFYYSGGESLASLEAFLAVGIKTAMFSYYYFRDKKDVDGFMRKYQGMEICLDSGAATFYTQTGRGFVAFRRQEEFKNQIDEYVRAYIEWLKKYKDYFVFYVEVDLDRLVGYQKIKEYREWFKEAGLCDNLMVVWHDTIPDNMREFKKMCRDYQWIGIAPDPSLNLGKLNSLFRIAKKYKRKVHGFALSKVDYMRRFPFYSLDSTSWKTGSQYGMTFYLQRGVLKTGEKGIRRRMKNFKYLQGYDIDWNKVLKDDNKEVDKLNLIAWTEYEKLIDKKQKKYWEQKQLREKEKYKPGEQPDFKKHKGKIQEILKKDPEVRLRRQRAVEKNLFGFKHGKRATNLPLCCNHCYVRDKCPHSPFNENSVYFDKEVAEEENPSLVYCALRKEFSDFFKPQEFGLRDVRRVEEAKGRVMAIQMSRAAMNYYFELLDGGIQDKALTALLSWIYERLARVPQLQVNVQQNILYQTAEEIREKFTEDKREELLNALKVEEAQFKVVDTPEKTQKLSKESR